MVPIEAVLREIRYDGPGSIACLECPRKLHALPGQYFLANSTDDEREIIPFALYPTTCTEDWLCLAPCPAHWQAGDRILLRGPFGKAFHLPADTRKVALFDWNGLASLLMPLIHQALYQRSEVVLYTHTTPSNLPPEVEVLPPGQLSESFGWCEVLAGVLCRDSLRDFFQMTGWRNHLHLPSHAEVLIHTPMPCGGTAECGICAILLKQGWKLACKEGAVFSIHDLEVE